MSDVYTGVVPRLVKNKETGNLCLQVSMGSLQATYELPPEYGGWDKIRQEIHIEKAVAEMVAGLRKRKPHKKRS